MNLSIRQERINKGWSQEYVAKKVDLSPEAIQMIETGKRKPSYDVLVKLEDLFKLTHRQLFSVADESNPSAK